jgi:hypothetical protein
VVVFCAPFVGAVRDGVALGEDGPVHAGRGEVVAWAEGGFEEEEGVGGCGEGHAVLGGVSLRQW